MGVHQKMSSSPAVIFYKVGINVKSHNTQDNRGDQR